MKKESYNTRQREIVLDYVKSSGGSHLNIEDINEHLKKEGYLVGKTTVYRYLELLAEKGIVKKFFIENGLPACYQYVDNSQFCNSHYHLKCTICGRLIHMECNHFEEMASHVFEDHKFTLDKTKIVLYGMCENCMRKEDF